MATKTNRTQMQNQAPPFVKLAQSNISISENNNNHFQNKRSTIMQAPSKNQFEVHGFMSP